jgi:hypothetical protein
MALAEPCDIGSLLQYHRARMTFPHAWRMNVALVPRRMYPPLNYIQTLGLMGDQRAVPVIRPYYEKYLKAMEAEVVSGVPDDVFFGSVPYHPFLSIAGDLFRITQSGEYEEAVRKYFDHSNEQVRWWTENALDVIGPTTQKRNEEYARTGRLP